MKKIFFSTILIAAFLLIGASCQKQEQTSEPKLTDIPAVIEELKTQEVPEAQKQAIKSTITEPNEAGILIYRGAWFDIEYPENFTARPLSPTADYLGVNRIQTNEAHFTSPDNSVEFFVFSPLWSGDPAYYLTISPDEELVNEKTDESGSNINKKIVHWVTVKAKDNSYYRSWVSIKEQVDTGSELHHVFGIKYQDSAAYDKYRDDYLSFKDSLIQYSD